MTKTQRIRKTRRMATGANDFSILNPTIWANEAVAQLTPNMVVSNLIARDYDSKVALFGDIVNAYVPGTFNLTFKGALCENVTVQDATGSRVQVALDQWPQVAFLICDGEENRNTLDLIDLLIPPAVLAFAQGIDRIVGAQVYDFLDNASGHLGHVDETNIKDYILESREGLNRKNAPLAGRTMILTPGTETQALSLDTIMTADKVGDGGTALANAIIGRKYGFDFVMTQTQPEMISGQDLITAAVNNAAGYPAGTVTSLAFDGSSGGTVAAGQWAVIAGDDVPQHITAVAGGVSVTITPGLKRAVADNAVITIVKPGAVNKAAGYAGTTTSPRVIGYRKGIDVDGFNATNGPQLGQMLTFGTANDRYIVTQVTNNTGGAYTIVLNRPLAAAIVDNATVNLISAGKYNFALLKQAFVLVNRPLSAPRTGTGAVSKVVSDPINKISIRVTISYDPNKQGHLVVLDTLMGVGTLSHELGAVMLG